MAILERTASAPDVDTDEVLSRGFMERLPIIGLAVVACISVGYGFGTLTQFDHDWRDAPPILLTSVQGVAVDGAPLEQVIVDLLAANDVTVSSVNCADGARQDLNAQDQMCLARGRSGMVSVVATGSGSLIHVDVYGTA
jgi:hypothetical protein